MIGPLSSAPTLSQSWPGSDGNEGVLCIPQSFSITGTSPSDCSVSYPGHFFVGGLIPLQRSSWCILQPQLTVQILGLKIQKLCVEETTTYPKWQSKHIYAYRAKYVLHPRERTLNTSIQNKMQSRTGRTCEWDMQIILKQMNQPGIWEKKNATCERKANSSIELQCYFCW